MALIIIISLKKSYKVASVNNAKIEFNNIIISDAVVNSEPDRYGKTFHDDDQTK